MPIPTYSEPAPKTEMTEEERRQWIEDLRTLAELFPPPRLMLPFGLELDFLFGTSLTPPQGMVRIQADGSVTLNDGKEPCDG